MIEMGGPSPLLRRWLAPAAVALTLVATGLPSLPSRAAAADPNSDGSNAAALAIWAGILLNAAIPADPATDAPDPFLAARIGFTRDPAGDVTGTVPATIPNKIADIQFGGVFEIPAGNLGGLATTCKTPPPDVLVICPPVLPSEDLSLVVFKLGQPLPNPWAPPDSKSLYLGLAVDSSANTTNGLRDPFHVGTDAVYAAGFGNGTRSVFIDGDPSKRPFVALDTKLGLAAVGMPSDLLKNGFRPLASIAGPPGGVADGAWDQLGGDAEPTSLLFPSLPLPVADDPVLQALGMSVDPKGAGPRVRVVFDPPKDLFYSAAPGLPGVFVPHIDIHWSEGNLLPAGSSQSIDTAFPCNTTNAAGAFTSCAPGAVAATGPFVVLRGVFGGPIPLKGADKLVYGAVFAGGGAPGKLWQAAPAFPFDTYQGTNSWFEETYDLANDTWTLSATKVGDGPLERGNATATSGARVIIDGSTMTWLIPSSEFGTRLPSWRLTSTVSTDGSFSPETTAVDVSSGGPGSSWALQLLADPTGLITIVPPKPAVTGGCVTVVPFQGPTPIALEWTLDIAGLDDIAAPSLELTVFYDNFSAKSTGALVRGGTVTFQLPIQPSKVRFDKLVVDGGTKPIDLTKSFHAVFGKGITASAKGGAHAGPDCP
jgi:hypothetical protein